MAGEQESPELPDKEQPEAPRVESPEEEREGLKRESLDAIIELQELSTRLMGRLPADVQERFKGDKRFYEGWITRLRSPEALSESECEILLKSIDGIKTDIKWLREFESNNLLPETPPEPTPPAPEEQAPIAELNEKEFNELKADYLSDIAKLQGLYDVHRNNLPRRERNRLESLKVFYTIQRERLKSGEPLDTISINKIRLDARQLKDYLNHLISIVPALPPIPEQMDRAEPPPSGPAEEVPSEESMPEPPGQSPKPYPPTGGLITHPGMFSQNRPEYTGPLTPRQREIEEAASARRKRTEDFVSRELSIFIEAKALRLAGKFSIKDRINETWTRNRLERESSRLQADIRIATTRLTEYQKRYDDLIDTLKGYEAVAETRPHIREMMLRFREENEDILTELPGLISMQKGLIEEYSKSLRTIAAGARFELPAIPALGMEEAGIPEVTGPQADANQWLDDYDTAVGQLHGTTGSAFEMSGTYPERYSARRSAIEQFFMFIIGMNEKSPASTGGGT